MRKILGAVLGIALLVAVGLVFVLGRSDGDGDAPSGLGRGGDLETVKGLIGSEKKAFFADEEVKRIFADNGLEVSVNTAGSREIANQDLTNYGFVFPASTPAAEKIKRDHKDVGGTYTPFYSPMVIATWEPIVDLLSTEGLVKKQGDLTTFDMQTYLQWVKDGKRWNEIPDNTVYTSSQPVLVTTTDVRRSNSAAMYLGVLSYAANGQNVVTTTAEVNEVIPQITPAFLGQGYVQGSSAGPFGTYLSMGMGQAPLVFAYESQYLEHQMAGDGMIRDDMRLVYPTPTINSQQTLVALGDKGEKVGQLLTENADLAKLAAKYGFRTTNPTYFTQALSEAGVPEPAQLSDVITPPSYEINEELIGRLEVAYDPSSAGTAKQTTTGTNENTTGDAQGTNDSGATDSGNEAASGSIPTEEAPGESPNEPNDEDR